MERAFLRRRLGCFFRPPPPFHGSFPCSRDLVDEKTFNLRRLFLRRRLSSPPAPWCAPEVTPWYTHSSIRLLPRFRRLCAPHDTRFHVFRARDRWHLPFHRSVDIDGCIAFSPSACRRLRLPSVTPVPRSSIPDWSIRRTCFCLPHSSVCVMDIRLILRSLAALLCRRLLLLPSLT